MTHEQRRLLAEHTRVMVHLLYCAYVAQVYVLRASPRTTETFERYEAAKATYLEREREARQAVQHD